MGKQCGCSSKKKRKERKLPYDKKRQGEAARLLFLGLESLRSFHKGRGIKVKNVFEEAEEVGDPSGGLDHRKRIWAWGVLKVGHWLFSLIAAEVTIGYTNRFSSRYKCVLKHAPGCLFLVFGRLLLHWA
jgi:hypothetical protein